MSATTRFGAANRGTKVCTSCGVLSWASRQDETANQMLCTGCYDAAGYENEHQDSQGDHYGAGYTRECPTCNPKGEERRLARCAARVAQYQATHLSQEAKLAEKRAAAAAKAASIKHCAGTDYSDRPCDGRASKTSDYCSICRPYHPHPFARPTKDQRTYLPADACGICGATQDQEIHA